jgi:hypothetical protein
LAKPILQDKVRQMLSEHDRVEAKRNNDAKADNKEAADAEGKGGGGAGGNVAVRRREVMIDIDYVGTNRYIHGYAR